MTRILMATVVLAVSTMIFAQDIESLKPMLLQTTLAKADHPDAVIVAGTKYRKLADALVEKLSPLTGVRHRVISDEQARTLPAGPGHMIALGQFANNRLLERLYDRHYLVVDGAHPGAGGYLVQSIHNPDALGRNVIVVGGSDDAGVERAADRFVELVRKHGATLPPLLEVELGWGKDLVRQRIDVVIAKDRVWPANHPMEIQQAVAEAGTLYLYTGDERVGQAYKHELLRFLERDNIVGVSDDFDYTVAVWDRIEESSLFSDDDRLRVTKRLWNIAQFVRTDEETNFANWRKALEHTGPRQNHQARYAGSTYFAGRYFLNYYKQEACRDWLAEVARYWKPQMTSIAVAEGTHPLGNVTLNKALEYALAENVETFLSKEVLGALAQRELARTIGARWLPSPNEFQPYLYWTVAAHRFNEPQFLRPLAQLAHPMQRLRMPWMNTWTIGGSHWDGTMPDMAAAGVDQWITPIRVDHNYYNTMQTFGAKNVPLDETFQTLVIQDPSLSGQQYMSLSGTSLAHVGTDGANAIEFLYLGGQRWLWGGGAVGGRVATAPKHSTLVVVRDGAIQPVPGYAKLVDTHQGEGWGVTRTALTDHNGVDWTRNVINVPEQFFLVIDEVSAKLDEVYTLESRWVGHEHAAFDGDDVIFPRDAQRLRLAGLGWQNQYMRPWLLADYLQTAPHEFPRPASFKPDAGPKYGVQIARRWQGRLKQGETHRFSNLFTVESSDATRDDTLQAIDDATFLVRSNSKSWQITRDVRTGWAVASVPSSGPDAAQKPVATRDNELQTIKPAWSNRMAHRVLSMAAVGSKVGGSRWAVGLSDGTVQMLDERGALGTKWTVEGRVFALAAMDLDGDGNDEIVSGTEAGRVEAHRPDGTRVAVWQAPPWKPGPGWRQMFGTWRNVITELHPFQLKDGQRVILAAGTFYTVLDASLKPVSSYEVQRELDVTDLPGSGAKKGMWLTDERTFIMTPVDFDGDGSPEVAGDEPDGRWLRVWDSVSGKRLHVATRPADRYLGTAIKSIAAGDLDGDGKQEAIVGADAFNQQLLVYASPFRSLPAWSARVSGAVEAVALSGSLPEKRGSIFIATEVAQLQAFDAEGKRLFVADTVEPVASNRALAVVTALGRSTIWLTTVNGRVAVFDDKGTPLSAGRIPGYGTHVVPSIDGGLVLIASADGTVQCYAAR